MNDELTKWLDEVVQNCDRDLDQSLTQINPDWAVKRLKKLERMVRELWKSNEVAANTIHVEPGMKYQNELWRHFDKTWNAARQAKKKVLGMIK